MPVAAESEAGRATWTFPNVRSDETPGGRDSSKMRSPATGRVEELLRRHASLVHEIE
jgi:hypothetical protein